jgi:phosphate starvation-inducible PhoH-like protein
MFNSRTSLLLFITFMFFCRHNIISSFSYMGRNRKTLGGAVGNWGEAIMETTLSAYSQHQQQRYHGGEGGGGKRSKQRGGGGGFVNGGGYATSNPASPSPYSARNKGLSNGGGGGGKNKKNPKYQCIRDSNDEPLYQPRTPNQALYLKYLIDDRVKIVLGVGPAGCGKTLFACHRAIEEYMEGGIQKIVITRPMVSVEDESVGFLPGDMTQKMAPWTRPIFDIFHEYFDPLDVQDMIAKGVIEISPLAYMRGRTFKDAFIIADEMQNSTPNQMLMLTTRLGENAKMAITGDLKQSDKGVENNGLADFMRKLYTYRRVKNSQSGGEGGVVSGIGGNLGVKLVQLCAIDVCRSEIVSRILDMYQVASEASLVSVSSDADMAVEDDSSEMGGEEGRKGAVEYIPKPPYIAKKPYYSVAKGSSSFSNENKNIVYQPKAKRYHQYAVKNLELEYEDDFEKNLKKIIDSTLVEQTAVLKEHSLEIAEMATEPETVLEEGAVEISSYPNELLEPTGIHEKVEEISPVQIQESKRGGHGSADCAMIPKQELDRGTSYFRFFSS